MTQDSSKLFIPIFTELCIVPFFNDYVRFQGDVCMKCSRHYFSMLKNSKKINKGIFVHRCKKKKKVQEKTDI